MPYRKLTGRLLLLCLSLCSFSAIGQTNLYVDSSMAVSGAGTNWSTAYHSVLEALNVANAASPSVKYRIRIARGTYWPLGQSTGTSDSSFVIFRGGIQLLGGYPNGGGVRNVTANPTILSGNINTLTSISDNSYHVMVIANIAATADSIVLDGLTIADGLAQGSSAKNYNGLAIPSLHGAGLSLSGALGEVFLSNCTFLGNRAEGGQGGGIYNINSWLDIVGCTFNGNSVSASGGAIYNNAAHMPNMLNCIFNGNYSNSVASVLGTGSSVGGGAIANILANTSSGGQVSGCTFNGNYTNIQTSYASGGAILDSFFSTTASFSPIYSSCTFFGNSAWWGGAIAVWGNAASPNAYVNNCTFNGNMANRGGAILNAGNNNIIQHATFTGNKPPVTGLSSGGGALFNCGNAWDCTFTNDSAGIGGAIFNSTTSNCRFYNNYASGGGAMWFSTNIPYISLFPLNIFPWAASNDTISGNTASGGGAGIYLDQGSNCIIRNTLICGNKTLGHGGAIYSGGSSSSTLINCTLAGDAATVNGNGIYNYSSQLTILNSIIWEGVANSIVTYGNTASTATTYSTVQGGYAGMGNISANPLFISPLGAGAAPFTGGNFQLTPCSPAINAGLNSGSYTGVADAAGNPRLIGPSVDMGAYEYQGTIVAFPPITGNNVLCAYDTLQLANTALGGTWTSSQPAVATVSQSGLVTSIAAGLDTISYMVTSSIGCSSVSKKYITVLPAYHDTLNAGTCTGTPYVFDGQSLSSSGTYTHFFTTTLGCDSNITLNLSVITLNPVISQSGYALTASPAGASYQWIDCGNGSAPIPGATGQTFNPAANGQYGVIITLGGCTQTSACTTVGGLGIAAIGQHPGIVIYPNPAGNEVNVRTGSSRLRMVEIWDVTGRFISTLHVAGSSATINTSAYPDGIYFAEFNDEAGNRWTVRFCIAR